MHSVAPHKLYTMEAGLDNATYSVLQLSQRLALIYYSHCQLTTVSFTKDHRAFNLAKKVILKFFIQYNSPVAIFKSTPHIRPSVTPLRETTSAVAKGVII